MGGVLIEKISTKISYFFECSEKKNSIKFFIHTKDGAGQPKKKNDDARASIFFFLFFFDDDLIHARI